MKIKLPDKFRPRLVFPRLDSIPKSYFLGHHRAGLNKMKNMLSSVDYIIECRDFRTPVTSINPMFEEALGKKPRLIVYTKKDLGGRTDAKLRRAKDMIRALDPQTPVFFTTSAVSESVMPVMRYLKRDAYGPDKLVACRVMVVGMPNVGKSTLINSLRNRGMQKAKAARTGDQPGITRKIGSPIKIIEREGRSDVYVLDTPGVFVPFIPDADRMLKLAVCGCVKDTVVPPTILADYLLFHINLHNPSAYERWCKSTNDIMTLLDSFAQHSGYLAKGGVPNTDLAALNIIQQWRSGDLGTFLLDDIEAEIKRRRLQAAETVDLSMKQAWKAVKAKRIQSRKERYARSDSIS